MYPAGCLWKRPVLSVAFAYALGTAAGLQWGGSPAHAAAAALAAGLAGWLAQRHGARAFARRLAWGAAWLLLAWALAARAGAALTNQSALLKMGADARGRIVVRGQVANTYAARALRSGARRSAFMLRRISLVKEGALHPLPLLRMYVTWYGPGQPDAEPAAPVTGEIWEMRGKLEAPRRPQAAKRLFFVAGARASRRIEQPGARDWRLRGESYRRRAAARLAAGLEAHPTETALIQAIMLGYRGAIPPALNRAFRNSGTIHVFAISGMHVVVIAWMLTFVVARLGIPRHLWVLPLAPLLTIYVCSTGGQPSALRAGIMALLYLAAPLLGRRPDTPSTLALAALLLLAFDPFQLHETGFILSFTVVAGLLALASPLARRLRRLTGLERLALDIEALARLGGEAETERRTLWRRRLTLSTGRYLTDLAGVSLAAWLTSAPLTACYFKLFTPVSLPANLVVVPLSFLVMVASSFSLALSSLAPALGIVCNRAACASTAAMTAVARTTASWSWGIVRLPQPPAAWLLAAWYAVLAWWAWSMARADRRADSDAAWLEEAERERNRKPPQSRRFRAR